MVENRIKEVLNFRDTLVDGDGSHVDIVDYKEIIAARDEKIELAVKNGVPFIEINIGALTRTLAARANSKSSKD